MNTGLSNREIWQDKSGYLAVQAEHSFCNVFETAFRDTNFSIRSKPDEFNKIYVDVPLDSKVQEQIYIPDFEIKKHGISPDYAIDCKDSNKTLYIEVKRQDGWVEGKPRSAGRGNAHERCCKYFTPGLMKILQEQIN